VLAEAVEGSLDSFAGAGSFDLSQYSEVSALSGCVAVLEPAEVLKVSRTLAGQDWGGTPVEELKVDAEVEVGEVKRSKFVS
jgi:hypothetical protein